MRLFFMLEEASMKAFLEGLLPRMLPPEVHVRYIVHDGKSDLEASLPRKLRAIRTPDTKFVVVRDQDSGDCRVIKKRLVDMCVAAGRPDTLIRIACTELEAWFIGDLVAVEVAFGVKGVARRQNQKKFRCPDRLGSPNRELSKLLGRYGKVSGARAMGPCIDFEHVRSPSFAHFVSGVRRLIESD